MFGAIAQCRRTDGQNAFCIISAFHPALRHVHSAMHPFLLFVQFRHAVKYIIQRQRVGRVTATMRKKIIQE